jgi:hypothetical protein
LLTIARKERSDEVSDPVRGKIMSKNKAGQKTNPMVSQTLRDAISERRLTAYAAAKQAGVSVDAIQRFMNEQRGLTLSTVDKLADSLGLTLCPSEPDSHNA